jgi:lactate 2-monooxygenase
MSYHRPKVVSNPDPNPIAYEQEGYARGLKYQRPPFTFDTGRMVKTTGFTDLSTVVFEGPKWEQRIPFTIAMAPVGVLSILYPEVETGAMMAAAKEKVPYILSTASSTNIEDVAEANGNRGVRWFQLYWPSRE